jgi:hypothetical protein
MSLPAASRDRRHTVAYEPVELGLPETPACPNKFEAAVEGNPAVLFCPGARVLILQVAANAIKLELGLMQAGQTSGMGGIIWQPHESFFPCLARLPRDFDALRVKNWKSGAEAQVLISVET